MNSSETKYVLGTMCGWSTPKEPWRHVSVLVSGLHQGAIRKERYNIELPEVEAEALCAIMGDGTNTVAKAYTKLGPGHAIIASVGLSKWCSGVNNTPVVAGWMHRIFRAAQKSTAWLGFYNMKYLTIRIDMRDGNFLFVDNGGQECYHDMIKMLEKSEKEAKQ